MYGRLGYCLQGVAAPNELIKDRRTTPYNIGQTLKLDDFDRAAEDLRAHGPLARRRPGGRQQLLDRVLYWTGGHPYLTVGMYIDLAEAGAATVADVDHHVEQHYGRLDEAGGEVEFQRDPALRRESPERRPRPRSRFTNAYSREAKTRPHHPDARRAQALGLGQAQRRRCAGGA